MLGTDDRKEINPMNLYATWIDIGSIEGLAYWLYCAYEDCPEMIGPSDWEAVCTVFAWLDTLSDEIRYPFRDEHPDAVKLDINDIPIIAIERLADWFGYFANYPPCPDGIEAADWKAVDVAFAWLNTIPHEIRPPRKPQIQADEWPDA
jgi:hypothetical protein